MMKNNLNYREAHFPIPAFYLVFLIALFLYQLAPGEFLLPFSTFFSAFSLE
jgi:hypothetical protein